MRKQILGLAFSLVIFAMNAAAQNTFPSSGNVGIGITTPQATLDVNGNIRADGISSVSGANFKAQGAYMSWNYFNGLGETDFVNSQGGGSGGFTFMNTPSTGTLTPTTLMFLSGSGNLGIGTGIAGPNALLQVGATYSQNPSIQIGGRDGNNSSTGNYSLLFGAYRDIESITSGIVATPVWTCCNGYPASSGYAGIRGNTLGFYSIYDPGNPTAYAPNMLLSTNGYIGIGTSTPSYPLDVTGSVHTSSGYVFPDGTTQVTAFIPANCGADYAEAVNVTGDRTKYEPGDLLVIDPTTPGKFLKSNEPYSTLVSGIYSTKPGFVGRLEPADPKTSAQEVPMAMVGRVPTKVSAENGPIKVGDLLVTSSTMGYAMKGTDRTQMLGAVVGKALGSLDSGTGVIEVLVTLQ